MMRINLFDMLSKKKVETPINAIVKPFIWHITLEIDTVRYTLAIDAGFNVISRDRDMITLAGDKDSYIEYLNLCAANKKAITKEFMNRYKTM